ncbi:hypothetical protein [Kaarinaea lacus]
MKHTSTSLVVVCLSYFIFSCSSGPVLKESFNDEGIPTWVNKGSKILKTDNNRLFHGVGSAPMLGDFSLQTDIANRRARQEMARIVSSYMEIVSRDYIASGKAAPTEFNELDVMKYVEKLSKMDLAKVKVVGHWSDERTNKIYAITQMDMDKVRQVVTKMIAMDAGLKSYLESHGGNVFDRIATVEE